jgi:quercetin dioxygenase-like cupin family protein
MNGNRIAGVVVRLRRLVTTTPHVSHTVAHGRARLMLRAVRILVVVVVVAGLTGTAGASPGSGTQSVVLAQGTMQEPFTLKRADASEVVFQQVTIQPGGHTGWHSHPGKLLAVVKSGTFTRYLADCTFKTFTQGESFIETNKTHLGRNNDSSVPVELYVTYINPPGSPLRTEAEDQGCTF